MTDLESVNTGREVARAARIGTRTRTYVLRDECGLAYEGNRCAHVLAAIGRSDLTAGLTFKVRLVAMALNKSISTGRMPAVSSLRIQAYTPYRLCALVARIAAETPETTIGGICDTWIAANHAAL